MKYKNFSVLATVFLTCISGDRMNKESIGGKRYEA